jgi:hypothetical protein
LRALQRGAHHLYGRGTAGGLMYLASGSFVDWLFVTHRVPAYTVELRPRGRGLLKLRLQLIRSSKAPGVNPRCTWFQALHLACDLPGFKPFLSIFNLCRYVEEAAWGSRLAPNTSFPPGMKSPRACWRSCPERCKSERWHHPRRRRTARRGCQKLWRVTAAKRQRRTSRWGSAR